MYHYMTLYYYNMLLKFYDYYILKTQTNVPFPMVAVDVMLLLNPAHA